jgi:hypothetical protein
MCTTISTHLTNNSLLAMMYFRDVDMAEYLAPECVEDNPNTSYDLIANICYEGQTGW